MKTDYTGTHAEMQQILNEYFTNANTGVGWNVFTFPSIIGGKPCFRLKFLYKPDRKLKACLTIGFPFYVFDGQPREEWETGFRELLQALKDVFTPNAIKTIEEMKRIRREMKNAKKAAKPKPKKQPKPKRIKVAPPKPQPKPQPTPKPQPKKKGFSIDTVKWITWDVWERWCMEEEENKRKSIT